jgi:hypothetical protein
MGFTKLDANILQSSIMAEDANTFKVWIALLASCGPDGISRVSSIYLSSVCHLPLPEVDKSIEILESPDSRSRSIADEGRRIRRVDGGYLLINYAKYRAYSYSREVETERKRQYRANKKQECPELSLVPELSQDISASASASVSSSEEEFNLFWESYPTKVNKKDAIKAFKALRKTTSLEEIAQAHNGYMDFLKHQRVYKNFEQAPMYPATFLRSERWKEYMGFQYKPKL